MRKIQFPAEFEKLSEEQLHQVNTWLDEHPYRLVHEKLETEFDIEISTNKLCRYCERRELFAEINGDPEDQLSVRDMYKLMNGEPVPYDEVTIALIAKKTYEHTLTAREISVNKLLNLQRLATYKTNVNITLRRLAIAESKQGRSDVPRASLSSTPAAARLTPLASANPASPIPATTAPLTPPRPVLAEAEWAALLQKSVPNPLPKAPAAERSSSEIVFPSALDPLINPPPHSVNHAPAELARLAQLLPQETFTTRRTFPLAA